VLDYIMRHKILYFADRASRHNFW